MKIPLITCIKSYYENEDTPMAKKNDEDLAWVVKLVGFFLIVPVIITAFIYYIYIYFRYISGKNIRRVMDIRRVISPIDNGIMILGVVIIAFLSLFVVISDANFNNFDRNKVIFLFIIVIIITSIISSMRIATLYMGVIVNKEKDYIAIPHDMQSYGILGYVSLKFIIDYGCVDIIKISQINKISRGRGKELYLHGEFGSRSVKMSSKQKRDECIAIIQSIVNKKGLFLPEIEGY